MILLKNCNYIITQNERREIIRNQDILIDKNKIIGIGKFEKANKIIDCSDKVVMPGLINAHTHSAMTLFRGYGDDMPLMKWLEERIWPAEEKLTSEHMYYGSMLAAIEMIKTGTTCFNDMYFIMEETAKACKKCNIRSVLTPGFTDCKNGKPILDSEFKEKINKYVEQIEKIKNVKSDLITVGLGPHAIYTMSERGLKWMKEYSEKNNMLNHIHLSETEQEVKDCVKNHGKTPVEYLNNIGFLSDKVIVAHGVWITKKEVPLLKDVSIVKNPSSNMKLGSGIMKYNEIKSLNICLGTDGPASNNNLNMFEEMKIAALLQKVGGDPTRLTAQEVLDMATINGAKALKINSGSIEKDKLADVIIIDINRPDMIPMHSVVSNLVYSFDGNVNTVIINGKIVLEDYKLTEIDEQEVYDKVNLFKF